MTTGAGERRGSSGQAGRPRREGCLCRRPWRLQPAAGNDRILIRGLLVRGTLGLTEAERQVTQDILISIDLYTDLRSAGVTDDPSRILNYRSVAKDVIRYVESSQHYLVEALATAIARICVLDHGADRVVVRVEKPGALRFARSVGVEIERSRADFADGEVPAAGQTDG